MDEKDHVHLAVNDGQAPTAASKDAPRPELEPCPFCGAGTTELRENGKMWTGRGYGEPSSVSVRHWCEPVKGQPSRIIERVGRDAASAIAAWNQRPVQPQGAASPQGAMLDAEAAKPPASSERDGPASAALATSLPALLLQAVEALEGLIQWDKARDFIVPYKVRDPIHAAIAALHDRIGRE